MVRFTNAILSPNLNSVFADCEDLSTTRGGGLAVLEVAKTIKKKLPAAELLSSGASQGLFRIQGGSAAEVEDSIRTLLREDDLLRHTTVLVATEPEDVNKFQAQHDRLKAAIRWEQMQGPSVLYPPLVGKNVCEADKVRPAGPDGYSPYTSARRKHGREQKTALLERILSVRNLKVVNDLSELAGDTEVYGNLKDKIAVLRFDGNNFGAMFRQPETPEDYGRLSKRIQDQQEEYFEGLLAEDPQRPRNVQRWETKDHKLRMEIVVYGGDEVTFIVPAHLGWEALHFFYGQAATWKTAGGDPITYSGAIVFCHKNAPIHAIKRLASDLVEAVKTDSVRRNQSKGNFATYQVMESFDALGEKVDQYLEKRYEFSGGSGMLLGSCEIEFLQTHMEDFRLNLSKRKLHKLVQELLHGKTPGLDSTIKDLMENKTGQLKPIEDALHEFHQRIGSNAAFLHLLDLWDYAYPAVVRKEER